MALRIGCDSKYATIEVPNGLSCATKAFVSQDGKDCFALRKR